MAVADRCQETTTTTGTGTLTLLGAATQHQSIVAGIGTGVSSEFAIVSQGGTDWEIFTGTLTNSTTLTRAATLSSSNANNPVNFSAGTKVVFSTIAAAKFDGKADLSGATFTGAVNTTVHTEAAHATTSDIWTGGNTCLLSGSVVTFTDVANAPAAGAVREVIANAAHIITDNAALEVDGNANYTCAVGDLLRFEAKTTSTFRVSVVAHGDGGGSGDAKTANPLSQFAATTSAQLAGVISNETGSGLLVFNDSPTLITPALGTPASGVATNLTGTAASLTSGNVTTNANLTGHVTSSGNAAVLGSFTSAQLKAALTNETGSGAAVFAESPTLVTPALGTPASGVVTNLTGTASININGTVGASTPAAATTTTLNTSGAVVFNDAGADVDFRVEGDTDPHLIFADGGNDRVAIGGADTSLFNGAGTNAKLAVIGSSNNGNVLQNGSAAIVIVNTDVSDENTAGLHFARADTDDTPNYAGASIVAQFKETQATGQYPSATLSFLTSSSQNAAPTVKVTIAEDGTATFTGEVIGTGFTGTLDGVLGGGTPAAASVTTVTATGDITMTGKSVNEAVHTEAAHATTSDIWTGGNTCLLSGSVVTFTDVADAPQAGAVRHVVANAAHVITDNSALEVDGNANYTCAVGDLLRFEAKTTSAFRVSVVAHGDGAGSGNAQTANPLSQFAATTSAQLAGVISNETGSGLLVFNDSPALITPALGTPASGVATNLTGTAASLTAGNVTTNANLTGHITSSGNAAVLGSFTSAQLKTALTNETGSGVAVFATSPTLVTPVLGTPASGVATNLTGTAAGLTSGNVTTNANLTGHITSTGNAAVLGSFTSAQLATALTNETGSGAACFATAPTIVGLTATGDITMTGKAINQAVHTEAAHATTSDIWTGGNTCLLSGSVVTFTDVADAPQAGAIRFVIANAAHILTDNSALELDGNANYTCAANDVLMFTAKTTSTFRVNVIAHGDTATGGGGGENGYLENSATVSETAAFDSGNNAISAGPVVVATGVTLTIPTGSRWAIV
jgi:hypothetical protein